MLGTVDGILKPKAGKQPEDEPEPPAVEVGVGEVVGVVIEGVGKDVAGGVAGGTTEDLVDAGVGVEDGAAVEGELK